MQQFPSVIMNNRADTENVTQIVEATNRSTANGDGFAVAEYEELVETSGAKATGRIRSVQGEHKTAFRAIERSLLTNAKANTSSQQTHRSEPE
jgi:hypothetical protein